jgi:hypothetical protein
MGNLIKIFLFLTLFNISFSEEEFYEEKLDYEVEAEEEVVTGKSLFFENSNLIRIEMRKDGDKKFGEKKAEYSKETEKTRNKETDSFEERKNNDLEKAQNSEEN